MTAAMPWGSGSGWPPSLLLTSVVVTVAVAVLSGGGRCLATMELTLAEQVAVDVDDEVDVEELLLLPALDSEVAANMLGASLGLGFGFAFGFAIGFGFALRVVVVVVVVVCCLRSVCSIIWK